MRKGERVKIVAPGTAWHGSYGTVTGRVMSAFLAMAPNNRGKVHVQLDHGLGDRCGWFSPHELVPESAVDQLARLVHG